MGILTNTVTQAMAGTADEIVTISSNFENNQVTVVGLATGLVTFEAMAKGGDAYEPIDGSEISDLSTGERSFKMQGWLIKSLRVNASAGTAYTLVIEQTEYKD